MLKQAQCPSAREIKNALLAHRKALERRLQQCQKIRSETRVVDQNGFSCLAERTHWPAQAVVKRSLKRLRPGAAVQTFIPTKWCGSHTRSNRYTADCRVGGAEYVAAPANCRVGESSYSSNTDVRAVCVLWGCGARTPETRRASVVSARRARSKLPVGANASFNNARRSLAKRCCAAR